MKSFKTLFQKLTDLVCIILRLFSSGHEDSSIVCIISFISVVFQRIVPTPFSLPVFTPIYPLAKHAYTSKVVFELKLNHLGKGSASLKTLT